MANVEKHIDVEVPVRTAYNQWTQFEDFPHFMEGVHEVRQLDDTHLHWRANVGGSDKEWDAVVTEQRPDERVAWRSTDGADNAGVVTFHRLGEQQTRVMLQLDYEPEGLLETIGDKLGFMGRRVQGDLERFKAFIESRGMETGAWRGEVDHGDVRNGSNGRTMERSEHSSIPMTNGHEPSSTATMNESMTDSGELTGPRTDVPPGVPGEPDPMVISESPTRPYNR